jgi:hypothetical protein
MRSFGGMVLFNAGVFALAYFTGLSKSFPDLHSIMPICIVAFTAVGALCLLIGSKARR